MGDEWINYKLCVPWECRQPGRKRNGEAGTQKKPLRANWTIVNECSVACGCITRFLSVETGPRIPLQPPETRREGWVMPPRDSGSLFNTTRSPVLWDTMKITTQSGFIYKYYVIPMVNRFSKKVIFVMRFGTTRELKCLGQLSPVGLLNRSAYQSVILMVIYWYCCNILAHHNDVLL